MGFRLGRGAGWRWLAAALALGLSACSGTIKPDLRVQGDISRVEGVAQVSVAMSPDAAKQLADSPQFNREELAGFLRRRLEGKGLVASGAMHRVDIVVTDLRVRGVFAAVMFGAMAGDDHVNGRVRILDERNRPIRSFDVQASYALGGWAGGQDGMRMNWLYDKFSELAVAELEKIIRAPRAGAAPAAGAPVPAAPPSDQVEAMNASAAPSPSTPTVARAGPVIPVDRIDAVPGLDERGRNVYRDWLSRRSPRAFVIAEDGRFNATWGTHPKDPMDPRDPSERALKQCRAAGKMGCVLYAVDDRVVYAPAEAAPATAP
jgi:hypothetical protein